MRKTTYNTMDIILNYCGITEEETNNGLKTFSIFH